MPILSFGLLRRCACFFEETLRCSKHRPRLLVSSASIFFVYFFCLASNRRQRRHRRAQGPNLLRAGGGRAGADPSLPEHDRQLCRPPRGLARPRRVGRPRRIPVGEAPERRSRLPSSGGRTGKGGFIVVAP